MNHSSVVILTDHTNRFDKETGLLYPSKAGIAESKKPLSKLALLILRVFSALGFVELTVDPQTGATETTNLTILNTLLVRFGPRKEDQLVKMLVYTQVCSRLVNPRNQELIVKCDNRYWGVFWRLLYDTDWLG